MSFAGDMSKFCKQEAPDKLDKTIRRVLIEISNRVVYSSPVGDPENWLFKNNGVYVDFLAYRSPPAGYRGGAFRMNWQYGFNSAPSGELDGVDPSGRISTSRIKGQIKSGPTVGMHYIVNNLPYAQRLEDGWSQQAPNGMVSLVELEFPAIVRMASA